MTCRRRLARLACAFGLALSAMAVARASGDDAFVAWARAHAIPLPACAGVSAPDAMEFVEGTIGGTRIVALGEPMHGAEEPLALRNCLFRQLVERHGFTAIALESGLNESQALFDHVLAGDAVDARAIARRGFTWGFGRFAANVALLEWMRRHNARVPPERQVRIYGIDLSGGDAAGIWQGARATLDDSLAFLSHAAPRESARVRSRLAAFLGEFTVPGYLGLPVTARLELHAALEELPGFFDAHRLPLIAASSQREFDWARQNAVAARQLEALFRVSRMPDGSGTLAPEDYRADAVRDAAMADNVRWVMEREGPRGRILLYAHNGHVMNGRTRGGIWSVYARAPPAMGMHLRAAFGSSLSIMAMAAEGEAGTLDAALARVGPGRFLLDLREAGRHGPAPAWLDRLQSLGANASTEVLVVPARAFDAFVFLRELTPALRNPPD